MSLLKITEWKKFPISLAELCLDTTLRCGQSFRWKQFGNEGEWLCSMKGRVISLRQDSTHLYYRALWPTTTCSTAKEGSQLHIVDPDDTESLIRHYFNLRPQLSTLYEQWSASDENFRKKAPEFTGIRILKQDPWEALISFICSSNNNIARISQMVNNLCVHYGSFLGTVEDMEFHDFPTPRQLAIQDLESALRKLGFGYRAKYIFRTAHIIADERPAGWLESIANLDLKHNSLGTDEKNCFDYLLPGGRPGYRHAHDQLLELQGVGPKVADCVCLMGLGWNEALPVDTHVWQFAVKDYGFGRGKHKSLTKTTYAAIGDHFRKLWGLEAGWAHSVLFAADLRTFAIRLATKTEIDIVQTVIKKEEDEIAVEQCVAIKNDLIGGLSEIEPLDNTTSASIVEVDTHSLRLARKRKR